MAISLKRYVDIVSGVGAGANVGTRKLIARMFDDNALIPTGSFVEFDSADEVGTYFGFASVEYLRAAFYFGWVSKDITSPPSMSFARWNSAASAPQIFGSKLSQSVSAWTPITSGSFGLTLDGVTHTFTGLNFSAAVSLSGVATIVQAAINGQTGSMWTGATVVYNASRGSFDFTGGDVGAADIAVIAGSGGSDIAAQLGWLQADAIISEGGDVQGIAAVLSESANGDNNFGSFAFVATLTEDQIVQAATWNDTQNNMFLYSVPVTTTNAAAIVAATDGFSGISWTLNKFSAEYPEQAPMMIAAATDYTRRNSTQNYMFQIFDLSASITTDAEANVYDDLRVNYYGQTQTAGQQIFFYQRGYMAGLPSDAVDQNIYVNEIWLKDAAAAAIMTLLLSLNKISANATGRSQILAILQGVIDQALFNGVISVGKSLTTTQKLYITNATGDPQAWKQVQNSGYWVDVVIQQTTISGITEYKAVYILIYSKDDVIRKVEGSDILI